MVVMIFIIEVPKVKSSSRLSGVGACSKEHAQEWALSNKLVEQKQRRQKMFKASTCQPAMRLGFSKKSPTGPIELRPRKNPFLIILWL